MSREKEQRGSLGPLLLELKDQSSFMLPPAIRHVLPPYLSLLLVPLFALLIACLLSCFHGWLLSCFVDGLCSSYVHARLLGWLACWMVACMLAFSFTWSTVCLLPFLPGCLHIYLHDCLFACLLIWSTVRFFFQVVFYYLPDCICMCSFRCRGCSSFFFFFRLWVRTIHSVLNSNSIAC